MSLYILYRCECFKPASQQLNTESMIVTGGIDDIFTDENEAQRSFYEHVTAEIQGAYAKAMVEYSTQYNGHVKVYTLRGTNTILTIRLEKFHRTLAAPLVFSENQIFRPERRRSDKGAI